MTSIGGKQNGKKSKLGDYIRFSQKKEQNFETLESLFRNCFNRQFSFDVSFYRISVPLVFRSLQYLIKSIIVLANPLSGHFRPRWPSAIWCLVRSLRSCHGNSATHTCRYRLYDMAPSETSSRPVFPWFSYLFYCSKYTRKFTHSLLFLLESNVV